MTGQEDTKVALEAMHGQLGILQRVLQKQQNEPAWKLYDLCETLKDELNTLKAGKEEPVIKLINDILVQVANLKVILSPHTMDAYFTGDGVRAIQDAAEEISRLADELHEADDTGVEAILVLSSQILDNGSIIEPSLAAASLSM